MTAPPPLGDCEVHDFPSDAVGDVFRVFVGHCHDGATDELPVVYLTDANGAFGLTVDIVRHLQLGGHLPQLLVVGIGYPVALLRQTMALRTRDLTPTASPVMKDSRGAIAPSGGAARFLSFVADELMPWVAGRYPIGRDATYVGHSLGGLFGAYALLSRTATFRGYALASPSIWWDDLEMLRREEAYAREHRDLAAEVVVTVGAEETPEGRTRAAAGLPGFARPALTAPARDMVDEAARLVDALASRRYPSLRLHFGTLPGEHHVTVPAVAVSHSLRVLFDGPGADDLVPRR
jgi:predicted alpha/beta superfamily hydrolase